LFQILLPSRNSEGRLGELATTEQDLKDLLKEVSDYDE
jgi:hypothetical protein